MDQPAFSGLEYQSKKRKARREQFLERIDVLLPWQRLEERTRPFYPKAGRASASNWVEVSPKQTTGRCGS